MVCKSLIAMRCSSNWHGKPFVAAQYGTGTGNASLSGARCGVFPPLRHWFVAHRNNKRLSSAALAFKEFLLTEVACNA